MSSNDKFQEEIEKRLSNLERIAKEISEHVELLKLLLADLSPKKLETVSMETSQIEESTPPNCLHYFGYLKFLPKNSSIPDECLTCQKVTECF